MFSSGSPLQGNVNPILLAFRHEMQVTRNPMNVLAGAIISMQLPHSDPRIPDAGLVHHALNANGVHLQFHYGHMHHAQEVLTRYYRVFVAGNPKWRA